jgi:cell fate regulator YaaT (PSP1 superfamily)
MAKNKRVGEGRYELYGIEGSVFNSMKKEEQYFEQIKQNYYKVKRKDTPTFNYKGEVVKLDTNFQIRPLYVLSGTYQNKSGNWIVFEYPDQSVIYRRAHRAIFEDNLNNITESVLLEKRSKQELQTSQKDAYSRVIKWWFIYQFALTLLLMFFAHFVYNAIRSRLIRVYSAPFKSYFEKLGLNLVYALPKSYIHEVTRRTGTYSGTVTGNQANLSENVSVKLYKKKTILFSVRNESNLTDFRLSYHKLDNYGKIANSQGDITKAGIRPTEPFSFVLIQPNYPKTISIEQMQVGHMKVDLSADNSINRILNKWPWLHETVGLQRLLLVAMMIIFGLAGIVALPLFTKFIGGPLVQDSNLTKTSYFSLWTVVAGAFAFIHLMIFFFSPKDWLTRLANRIFIVLSIGSLGFPFIVMFGIFLKKIEELIYIEPTEKQISSRDKVKNIFMRGLFFGIFGLLSLKKREEVRLKYNGHMPCNFEELEVD